MTLDRTEWNQMHQAFRAVDPGLARRTTNCLFCCRIRTLDQVWGMTDEELLAVYNFGRKSLAVVRKAQLAA